MRTKTTTKRDSLLSVGVGATLTVALTSTMGAYAAGPANDELAAEAVTPPAPRSLDGLIDRLDTLERDNSYLQAEVEQLRQEAGQEWLTEKRSAEIRGLVQDVLADSSSRMSRLTPLRWTPRTRRRRPMRGRGHRRRRRSSSPTTSL